MRHPPPAPAFWTAVAWVVLLSTFGGYGLYWLNLKRSSVTRVSSLIYLTPPTTLVWAFVMFGQPITTGTIAGVTVCVAGVLIVRGRAPTRAGPPARVSEV